MFAGFSNLQRIACLPLHNAIGKWHKETLLLAGEEVTVISQKKPINKTMALIILMCYVRDPSNMALNHAPVLNDRYTQLVY
jgi:hypothetical protein